MSLLKSCSFVFTLILFSIAAFAAIEPPEGYQIETVATYTSTGLGQVRGLALDDLGNLYASHLGTSDVGYANGSITKISSNSVETQWAQGIGRAGRLVWGGGTAFGDFLYVSDPVDRWVKRVDSNGNATRLAYVATQPLPLDIDRNGAYGGNMYTGTWGTDGLYSITAAGLVSKLGTFPSLFSGTDGGGPMAVKFAPGQRYGGKMYVGWNSYKPASSVILNGIHSIDSNGDASFFITFSYLRDMAFDTHGSMFNGDLFAIGSKTGVEGMHLWRIDELGNAEDFARVGWGLTDHIAFGPDGSMYLSKYTGDTTEILRISEVPEPASLLMLGLGGFLIRRKRKLS